MIFHSVVAIVLFGILFAMFAIDGNLTKIARALKAQNEYYGIFEQTSEEQEIQEPHADE